MGTFRVPMDIGDPQGQNFETVDALVDTGAAYTILPASALQRLGIVPHRTGRFQFADGRNREFQMGRTWVRVGDASEITLVIFGEENVAPIMGAYTMEALGLMPDPINQKLIPVDVEPLMTFRTS